MLSSMSLTKLEDMRKKFQETEAILCKVTGQLQRKPYKNLSEVAIMYCSKWGHYLYSI